MEGSGLGLSYPMYIYMPFLNLENKLVLSLFKFTYLLYISLSKLKPKPNGRAILFFLKALYSKNAYNDALLRPCLEKLSPHVTFLSSYSLYI